jgi:hypothetical protein
VVVVVVVVDTPVVAVAAAVTLVEAVLVAAILVEAALAVPVLGAADFAQLRRGSGVLNLPLEVSADQPVHSDITTEAAARLLLGHTNTADGETNR